MKYHIHTIGCQMNVADSLRLASELEKLGGASTDEIGEADVAVLNTCVVRQSAEDRANGWLQRVGRLKNGDHTGLVVGLMGCLVGVKGNPKLARAFPQVDVFLPPSDPTALLNRIADRNHLHAERAAVARRHAAQVGELTLPLAQRGRLVSAHVPVVYGCSHACTFCIIPFRRGVERSRPVGEITAETRSLAAQSVREITLLGQIVDRYGCDVEDGPDLAQLLRVVHETPGLERIRFLTSHPNYMNDDLLRTVAALPRICEHIEVPVQSGNNTILQNMRRDYTVEQYRSLVGRIREHMPAGSIACDVIVGFPGESEAQFQDTHDLLAELKLDKVHIAKYSPRPGTLSARHMVDDVPAEEKERRRKALDDLQAGIVADINNRLLGERAQVLVEDFHRGKWRGRTRTNKLVFFEDERDRTAELVDVEITWAGPWSLRGRLPDASVDAPPPLAVTVA
ncbi:MAG TPA: tRNA (N6-isopentenyl adenosine(37)-C2)-methylthiotransferase MiaB [Anaerolineales bacterium]|jgi:tRNA-2-methylthio-N6-dimethylallyladenosine synthase|nr:tRNA (N6-isopentenyl adenosine(37)-C2)-methylthiotransferase MiaB [Anaerolineales bacterium]